MKIKASDLLGVLKEYDFLSFPRVVGNPYQEIVFNCHGMWNFIMMNNAVRICFTSHNAYPGWEGNLDPTHVRQSKLFFDFDHETKPENPLRDARRLASLLTKEELPWASTFSGKKGMHVYAFLERENLEINTELWNKTIAVHSWLRYKGEKGRLPTYKNDGTVKSNGRPWLKTLDPKVAEPKRLCRIPFTRHVKMGDERKYIVNSNYCVPVKPNHLVDWEYPQILASSKNPRVSTGYQADGRRITLDDFIAHFDINIKFWMGVVREAGGGKPGSFVPAEYNGVPDDSFAVYVSKIIPRPCVHGDLFTENPSHPSRMMAVVQLKRIGWTFEEVAELFDSMADKFKWADRANRGRRLYQIQHIYYKQTAVGGYWHAKCTTIKNRYHLCVGDKCPDWFKTEDDKHGTKN